MRTATQIGAIEFLYAMWVNEYENPNTVMGEMVMSADGSHVAYQAPIKTPYITLTSRENGWLSEANVDALKASYDQLDTTFTLTYGDLSTETIRFAHEKGISFTPIHEGSCYFYATINLAKVI